MRRTFSIAITLALVVSACDGGGGDDSAELSQAIADAVMEEAGEDSPFDQGDADCFGVEVVQRVGVDRLEDLGLGLDDLREGADPSSVDLQTDDVDKMLGALSTCVDFGSLVLSEIAGDIELSDESSECLAQGINDADFLGGFAESLLLGGDIDPAVQAEMAQSMFALFTQCLTADELRSLGG